MCSTVVDIDVKRCLCIHSIAQLIDVTLQSLLYQRHFLPEPVSTFIKTDSHVAEQFSVLYKKVAHILQETFRSPNAGGSIAEFIILIGGTPYSPKEIYRIPVHTCRSNSTMKIDNIIDEGQQRKVECDKACGELTAKEKRLLFSAVALSKTAVNHFENCPIPGKTDKVFMFIRTRGQLNTWTEGLTEDDSFELPDEEVQRRRKIRQLRIQVNMPSCYGTGRGNANISSEEGGAGECDENMLNTWYRLFPFFTKLH